MIPEHTVGASALWSLLDQLVKGSAINAAAQALGLPFASETLYHLLHRLRSRLTGMRSLLAREREAPASLQSDPLLQTAEHLRLLFPKSPCPAADFQLHFQHPLLE